MTTLRAEQVQSASSTTAGVESAVEFIRTRDSAVSVTEFGADLTGATDSRSAVQAAIDAVFAAGGGDVLIPKSSTLKLSSFIDSGTKTILRPRDGVNIVGAGYNSVIKIADGLSSSGDWLLFNAFDNSGIFNNIHFKNFRINCSGNPNVTAGPFGFGQELTIFNIRRGSNIVLDTIWLEHHMGSNPVIFGGDASGGAALFTNGCIKNCTFTDCGNDTTGYLHDHSTIYTVSSNVVIQNNTFNSQAINPVLKTFTVSGTTVTSSAHGFSNGQVVRAFNFTATLPAPINANGLTTAYVVINAATNTLQLANLATPSIPINFTTAGSGTHYLHRPSSRFHAAAIETHSSEIIITNNYVNGYLTGSNIGADTIDLKNQLYSNNIFTNVTIGFSIFQQATFKCKGPSIIGNSITIVPNGLYTELAVGTGDPGVVTAVEGIDGTLIVDNFFKLELAITSSISCTVTAASDLIGSTSHGLNIGDKVFFDTTANGLIANIPYFVIAGGFTANAFEVSLTSGGSVVDITNDGANTYHSTIVTASPQGMFITNNILSTTISKNYIRGFLISGMTFQPSTGIAANRILHDLTISENTIIDCGIVNSGGIGIITSDNDQLKRLVITNNKISTISPSTMVYGIVVQAHGDDVAVRNNDIKGFTTAPELVQAITSLTNIQTTTVSGTETIKTSGDVTVGGNLKITGNLSGIINLDTSILFASTDTSPTISQADKITNSGTGAPLIIQAQNETGTTSTGGSLFLSSGSGTSAHGGIVLELGEVILVNFNGTALGSSALTLTSTTSFFINQSTLGGTGATNGKNITIIAQAGQQQSGGNANTNGGNLVFQAGPAGTGGGGTAGNAGSVLLDGSSIVYRDSTSTAVISFILSSAGTSSISIASSVTSFIIAQADKTTNSGTAADLTIQAQAETGTTSIGGNLILSSGAGTSTNGSIILKLGSSGSTALTISSTNLTIAAGYTLATATTGNINLPNNGSARFQIEGVAITSTVTAANLTTLTNTSNADTLHTHAGAFVSATAGATIAAKAPVGLENSAGSPRVFNSDSNDSGNRHFCVGIAVAASTNNNPISIQTTGEIAIPDAIFDSTPATTDVGALVFLSETAGNLTLTAPTTSGSYSQKIGVVSVGGSGNVRIIIEIGDSFLN